VSKVAVVEEIINDEWAIGFRNNWDEVVKEIENDEC